MMAPVGLAFDPERCVELHACKECGRDYVLVKGFVYHETAALVFGAIVAATLVALGVYHHARAAEEVTSVKAV